MGSIPGSGRSPGEENINPLQYSCLGNSRDSGAWWATVHGVTKNNGHNLATKQQQENYALSKINHFMLSDFSPHCP